ncbi:MAG TPA: tubulin-like doman-containing protein [Gemmatales bacterium]|nr:tubulin-like doman-containing protein [Gemmatales bacterium]
MPVIKEANIEALPGYRLIEPLGTGGFGEVWKCEAPGGIFKAIKFVYGNLHALDTESIRAEQELQALERVKNIRHPFILSIERVEEIAGELIIVMELADKDLHDVLVECRTKGQVGIERTELLQYLRDAAEALDLMHRQHGLQHLDIKPSNLFLVSNRVKVADFGLVKALEGRAASNAMNGLIGGVTPVYAAPETFRGEISPHSDQYSLAIVYQELLTGGLPFKGRNARQLMFQHTQTEPDLESLPPTDRPVVARALAKEPTKRFNTCIEFIRALIQSTPGPRKWESMEDIFLEPQAVFTGVIKPPTESLPRELDTESPATLARAGVLRPTLLVGLGHFGREALQALRTRIIDRFGSLEKLPLWRFLYIDTDAKDLTAATAGPPEQALAPTEVLHLPLHQVGHYRRSRQNFEHLMTWMPMDKFYDLPRSPSVEGHRMFGRLAFLDGYLRLVSRLKKDLQAIANPEAHDLAVASTGLTVRTPVPRVHVFAAAAGGTGSGMLIDLAYTLRRLLQESDHVDPELVAFLLCGAPTDQTTPPEELANLYATLTELQHFSSRAVEFLAEYGAGGATIAERAPPFSSVYLARVGHRGPGVVREVASRLASYIFHDLGSVFGAVLDQSRRRPAPELDSPFRSFGAYTIWFPRGLMLRVAARLGSERMINAWLNPQLDHSWQDAIHSACDQLLSDPLFANETLIQRLEQAAATPAEGTPSQALTFFLTTLENQAEMATARDDPANWCAESLRRIKEWVGGSSAPRGDTSDWQKSRLNRIYATAVQKLVDEYTDAISQPSRQLFDAPGPRLAAADAAYRHLYSRFNQLIEAHHERVRERRTKTEQAWVQVNEAFQACMNPGSFFLFAGMRTQKLLRSFVERVAAFTRERLLEQAVRSVEDFYRGLQGKLIELQRDLGFCMTRLRQVEQSLLAAPPEEAEAAMHATRQEIETQENATYTSSRMLHDAALVLASRMVLPEGDTDLERAASRFLAQIAPQDWLALEAYIQDHVLTPNGGLHHLCMTNADLPRTLNPLLLEKAAEFLDQRLGITDVCQAELSSAQALGVDLVAQTRAFHRMAVPPLVSRRDGSERHFLLVPDTPAGHDIQEISKKAVTELIPLPVASPTDLLLCREQMGLMLSDLRDLLVNAKKAYQERVSSNMPNPHCRADVLDWLPMDP